MNILFVRLSYIGDILHATPAARWIKQQYPESKLHWIVTPGMAELLEGNPYVDRVIPWERDIYEAHAKQLHISEIWRMWWELRDALRPKEYDVAVDVQGRLISGLVLLASGAPVRLGLGGTKELNWMFTNHKSERSGQHVIKEYLDVAKLLPEALQFNTDTGDKVLSSGAADTVLSSDDGENPYKMDLFLNSREREHAKSVLNAVFQNPKALRVGLVLGTSWKTKAWPQNNWLSLIRALRYRADFICFGGEKEKDEYRPLIHGVADMGASGDVYDAIGKTSLRETAALIQECDVVVAGDTGGLHMALALGVPVVALFGPTDPEAWGPLTGSYKVITNQALDCLGCRKRKCPKPAQYCMSGIDATEVKKAILELTGRSESGGDPGIESGGEPGN